MHAAKLSMERKMRKDLDNRIFKVRLDKIASQFGREFSIKIRAYARRFYTVDQPDADSNDGSVVSAHSRFSNRSRSRPNMSRPAGGKNRVHQTHRNEVYDIEDKAEILRKV